MIEKLSKLSQDDVEGLKGELVARYRNDFMLFADMLPDALARNFSVVDNRITLGLDHIRSMARQAEMEVVF